MTDQRTAMFNDLRKYAPERRFSTEATRAIDALADSWGLPRIGGADWLPFALNLIKQFEGCKLTAYADPGTGGKPWTIGWGSTTDEAGKPIDPGTKWTQDRADKRLAAHIMEFGRGVDELLGDAPVTPSQKGALVSFAYNLGLGNLASSTLLKKHKAADYGAAAGQFGLWNKAAGKVLNGLTRRREAEARTYAGLPM